MTWCKSSRQDILKLLDKLDIRSANGMQSNCIKLGKMPINDLKQRLQELSAATNGKTSELQERLFNMLLGRDVKLTETTSETQNNASDTAIKMMILYGTKELGLVYLLALRTSKSIWVH